jgi:hypothetical protein
MTKALVFVGCVAMIVATACGSESQIVDPGTNHGVASDKEISSLTQGDLDKICQDVQTRVSAVVTSAFSGENIARTFCTVTGLLYTVNNGTVAQCETRRDQCIQNLRTWFGDAGATSTDAGTTATSCPSTANFTQCDALVSEVDACTDAQVAAYQSASATINAISCDNAGKPIDAGVFGTSTLITSFTPDAGFACNSLYQKCPSAALF